MANPTPAPTPSSQPPAASSQTPVAKAPVTENKPAVTGDKATDVAAIKKYKVKIDNAEREVTEKELIDGFQLRELSDKKRSEAEKYMAEYKKLHEHAQKDPIKLLQAMGVDFDKLSVSYLSKKAEDAMKDPKQLEQEKTKAELEQYKKWVEEQKTKQADETKKTAVAQERQRLHQEVIEAVQEKAAEYGLPVDENLIIAVAQDMLVQDKAKKGLNAKEALPKTYERLQKQLHGISAKMDGEGLVKWLGSDVANKIRKYDLAQLKAKRASTAPQGNSLVKPQAAQGDKAVKPMTWSEFKKTKLDTIQ